MAFGTWVFGQIRSEKGIGQGSLQIGRVHELNMKNSPLTTVLLSVLAASTIASVVLCALYISNTRQLRALQSQAAMAQNNRTMFTMLANDVVEYSKKNPAINPILEASGLRPKSGAATTNKPSAK